MAKAEAQTEVTQPQPPWVAALQAAVVAVINAVVALHFVGTSTGTLVETAIVAIIAVVYTVMNGLHINALAKSGQLTK